MKVNELRIGNFVQDVKYKKTKKIIMFLGLENLTLDVEPFLGYEEDFFDLDIAKMQSIPLTEEWLLRLGYAKISNNSFIISEHAIWICNNSFMCDKNGIVLRTVHQIQNLYFALTNEELIIKL